jgi:hypothetical protein
MVEMLLNNLVPQACTPTIRVPFLASHVHLVNSQVKQVVLRAMIVVSTQKQLQKDRLVAMIVTRVRCPRKEVPNVSHVVRVRLAMDVKIAPKDMREKEPTILPPNANNVN